MDKQKVASELLRMARNLIEVDGEKVFYTQNNVGKAGYAVNYHDGEKAHSDGSPFYDIALFSNKKAFMLFVKRLKQDGYRETN